MTDVETFTVRISVRGGRRHADRRRLQVPWEIATGALERASDRALRDMQKDIAAEQDRRGGTPTPTRDAYDPMTSQITGATT